MYFDYFYCPIQHFYRQHSQGGFYPQPSTGYTSTSNIPFGPPPPYIPSKTEAMIETWESGPGAFMLVTPPVIQTHLFSYVYIWLKDGGEFWGWLNHVDPNYTSGFRWDGHRWVPVRISIRLIDGIARF